MINKALTAAIERKAFKPSSGQWCQLGPRDSESLSWKTIHCQCVTTSEKRKNEFKGPMISEKLS